MAAIIVIGGDPNKVNVGGYVKGDVLAADGAGDLVAVPVGPNGDVLTADSAAGEGVDWQPGGGGGGGTPSNTVVTETSFGQAATAGVAVPYSRGDHTHGTPAAPSVPSPSGTVVTETSFGQASSSGVAGSFSRGDHTHGTPAAPSVPSAASSVVAETTFGQGSAVGVGVAYARNDHTHGTPSLGTTSTTAAAGNDARFTLAPGYYPLSAYGFVGITGEILGFTFESGLSSGDLWLPNVWVPAGTPIASCWVNISTAGSFGGTANFNGAVVYEANGSQAGISANDSTLWNGTGWKGISLTAPVAAQTTGRFVRVGMLANGWSGLKLWYAMTGTGQSILLNGGATATHRRNFLITSQNTMPASINPSSDGTTLNFLPPFAIA